MAGRPAGLGQEGTWGRGNRGKFSGKEKEAERHKWESRGITLRRDVEVVEILALAKLSCGSYGTCRYH